MTASLPAERADPAEGDGVGGPAAAAAADSPLGLGLKNAPMPIAGLGFFPLPFTLPFVPGPTADES